MRRSLLAGRLSQPVEVQLQGVPGDYGTLDTLKGIFRGEIAELEGICRKSPAGRGWGTACAGLLASCSTQSGHFCAKSEAWLELRALSDRSS